MIDVSLILGAACAGLLYVLFRAALLLIEKKMRYDAMLDEYALEWEEYFHE